MTAIQLKCQCNSYSWGKFGRESLAARYAGVADHDFHIDHHKPYAEMWMGTYPTTPSVILSNGELLQKHIDKHPDQLIGPPVLTKYGTDLPFLPKILSIAKALPLQIHPDKELATKLHERQPEKFGDANHKPEIAVALGQFEVFVGWMPLENIQYLFNSIPILRRFVGQEDKFTYETVRSIVKHILSAEESVVTDVVSELRNMAETEFPKQPYIPGLLHRLAQQYDKSDPGILVALLTMNFLVLQKGEAIFVPSNGIHAYLSGDIVECMARSDNVLNTGFCPRVDRDSIEMFIAALNFDPKSKYDAILRASPSEMGLRHCTTVLSPPLSEFQMLITKLNTGETETISALQGPSIMVITSGSGTMKTGNNIFDLQEGYVFFIGYASEVELDAYERLEVHIAYCEA